MRKHTVISACTLVLSGALVCVCQAAGGDKNVTGLPTYPDDTQGKMDAVSRSIPNGQHCIHYSGSTNAPLATVEEWYKKSLPAAKIEDINKNSLYGGYFKLDGIKLLMGNDIVNVYRMAASKQTTIEIFKCSDAAPNHS